MVSAVASGTIAAITTAQISPTVAGDLLIQLVAQASSGDTFTWNNPPGLVQASSGNYGPSFAWGNLIQSVQAAVSGSVTSTASGVNWASAIIALKLANAPPEITGVNSIGVPTQTAPSTSTTGGSLAAATYYGVVTASNANGESLPSSEESITTTGTTSTVTWNFTLPSGATSGRIYIGTATGAENTFFELASGATSYTYDGSSPGTYSTPPVIDTTGTLSQGSTGNVLTGTTFDSSVTLAIQQPGGVSVAIPCTYVSATEVTFDLTQSDTEPTTGDQLAQSDTETYPTTLVVTTTSGLNGRSYQTVYGLASGYPAATLSLLNSTTADRATASPALASGDQISAAGNSTGTSAAPTGLSLNSDGSYTFASGDTPANFYLRAYDGTNKVWGLYALQTVDIGIAAAATADSTFSANLTTAIQLAASVTEDSSLAASLATGIQLAAAAQTFSNVAAQLNTQIQCAAQAKAVTQAAGDLLTQILAVASATDDSTASGTLTTPVTSLAGDAQDGSILSGSLNTQIQLVGSAADVENAVATLATKIELGANALSITGLEGTIQTGIPVAGGSKADSTLSGVLSTSIKLVSAAKDVSAASVAMLTSIRAASQATEDTTAQGQLSTRITLAGAAAAVANAVGALTTMIRLVGSVLTTSAASGDLTTRPGVLLEGAAQDGSSATGDLSTATPLEGAAADDAVGTAVLSTGIPLKGDAQDDSSGDADLFTSIDPDANATDDSALAGSLGFAGSTLFTADVLVQVTPMSIDTQYGLLPMGRYYQRVGDKLLYAIDWTGWLALWWKPSVAVVVGNTVRPWPPNGFQYACVYPGVTDSLPPPWPPYVGSTVQDGSAQWNAQLVNNDSLSATLESANWSAPTGIAAANQIISGLLAFAVIDSTDAVAGQTYDVLCTAIASDGRQRVGKISIVMR